MVDPEKVTNYNLDDNGLEEHLLFWIAVAGKTARVVSRRLQNVLDDMFLTLPKRQRTPFEAVRRTGDELGGLLKENGIGCWSLKSRAMLEAANSGLDLRTCSTDDLETIHGIGMKTARCFIMHTRRNAKCAGLDTHVLHFMRDHGFDVPKSTPGSKKKYRELENQFLGLAHKYGYGDAISQFDLMIWNSYSAGGKDAFRHVRAKSRATA